MHEQFLVEVYVPTVQCSFMFWISTRMKVQQAIELISEVIEEREPKYFVAYEDLCLCSANTNQVLNPNKTIYEQCSGHGEKLILL